MTKKEKEKLIRQALDITLRSYFVRAVEAMDRELQKLQRELKLDNLKSK
jgi:hypothetical protein